MAAVEQSGEKCAGPLAWTGQVAKTGKSNEEIAEALVVSENTVKYHLKNIFGKLHLRNRAQVVAYAIRHDLYRPPRDG